MHENNLKGVFGSESRTKFLFNNKYDNNDAYDNNMNKQWV